MTGFSDYAQTLRPRIEQALANAVPTTVDSRLAEAMGYALSGGGKRIRPLLVLASYRALTGNHDHPALDNIVCAVEAIHAYSLVHDDLPAMDDDELRRGQPTCHIAFDEALAILAGDALQTLAFETLSQADSLTAEAKLALIQTLAQAAGAQGMVLGQAIDLAAVDGTLTLTQLERMHRCKTGALIDASVAMGAIAADADAPSRRALENYSRAIGLAFQVQDDILDVTADTATLGKTQGADAARNKPTYVSLLGLEAAREHAHTLLAQALDALAKLPGDTQPLRLIAQYVVERER
ncbi:polyprenyl synthetase family protein [Gilvimarinus xylanilyticus]|uniref:Polyprenyl synthetase family protein n=1 Tax=Gilvimarinus xylanilyticus TaxID=2944139 RepID=A0A9X2KWY4_9GAMM|nr:farnesyl diphosphate synthase [Gilvimarinus xylanilyticus]MCP8899805.1 polyprenyl synthetase family protein [Gilvimarinus xylanilyticus]